MLFYLLNNYPYIYSILLQLSIVIGCPLLALLITVSFHELGHLLSALICKVKVKAYSIGFWRPYLEKEIKGLKFRLTPFLLGGYTELEGETNKNINGFLAQRYSKKFLILISGVIMNFFIAGLCYLINYNSIKIGIIVDWILIKAMFSRNYIAIYELLVDYSPNLFLLNISVINLFCGLANLFPLPALDGGQLWTVWLEKRIKNFPAFHKRLNQWGFRFLMLLQIIILYIVWNK